MSEATDPDRRARSIQEIRGRLAIADPARAVEICLAQDPARPPDPGLIAALRTLCRATPEEIGIAPRAPAP